MKIITVAYKYLRKYPFLTLSALGFIIAMSFFDGASFGMIIPLIQSMMSDTGNILGNIPFINKLGDFFPGGLNQSQTVSLMFILLFVLLAAKNIFLYFSNIFITNLRFKTMRDLRVRVMSKLLGYDMKYFDGIKAGQVITNVTVETRRICTFVQAVLLLTALLARVVAYIVVLCLISWKASILIGVLITSVLIPLELIMKRLKKLGQNVSEVTTGYNYKLTEILSGIRLIISRGTERLERDKFAKAAEKVSKYHFKVTKYTHMLIPLAEVFMFGLIVASFLFLVNVVKIDIAGTFPFIAAYLVVLTKMLTQLNALNTRRAEAISNLAAFTNYEDMCDEKGKRTIISGTRHVPEFSRSIDFVNVNFSYNKGKEVLKDINISIPQGKVTALVGASGAGKSTLVNLIPRFYDVDSGGIEVDGVNIKDLIVEGWRGKIEFVSQDVFIFNSTVKDNISYGSSLVTDEDILSAAKTANAHEFIMSLAGKYDTILGERGVKLSGGQKQRVSIARAIIHNPGILILDEATSSLDTETERLITEALGRLTKERTVIAIAHRLSTILHADNIIVMDRGRVMEQGTHEELFKKGGFYKKLYDIQFNIKPVEGNEERLKNEQSFYTS